MTDDYDLQLAMMEKIVMDKPNPLTVIKNCGDLNLRYERLKTGMKTVKMIIIRRLFFGGQFKGKFQNCSVIGYKAKDCKAVTTA
jgi:hypothetical protein